MKATFFERLFSYIIDAILVSVMFTLICMGISTQETQTEKLMAELNTQLMEKTITTEEYLEEYEILVYEYQKENILTSGISIALTIAYYIVFQYMNKGQTIGKNLLKIKVVDKDTEKEISILKGVVRSIFIYNIASGLISLPLLYILNQNNFFSIYSIVVSLEMVFVIISLICILYRKDKRGLHDILTNTMVIKTMN